MKQKILLILKHEFIKGSALVFIGSMIASVFNYIFHMVTGRMLGPEKYAILASLLSLTYIIGFPGTIINTVVTRKVASLSAEKNRGAIRGVIQKLLTLVGIVGVLLFFLFYFIQEPLSTFLNIKNTTLIVLLGITLVISLLSTVTMSTIQGTTKFFWMAMIVALSAGIKLFTAYFAIEINSSVLGVMIGLIITGIISFALTFIPLRVFFNKKRIDFSYNFSSYLKIIWIASGFLGMSLMINIDVILVKHFFTDYNAGLYAALSTMGKVTLFISAPLVSVLLPIASRKHAQGKSAIKELLLAIFLMISASLFVVGIYYFLPDLSIGLLYGQEYKSISSYLYLFGLYFMFYSLTLILVNYYIAQKRTVILLLPLAMAIVQTIFIFRYHENIGNILAILLLTGGTLVVLLIGYLFWYEKRKQ